MARIKQRVKEDTVHLVPDLLDGYDFFYHNIQNFRNKRGLFETTRTFVGTTVDVIQLETAKEGDAKFVVIAKDLELDEAIPEREKNTDYKQSRDLLLMTVFAPEKPDLEEPKEGQLVYLEYTDPINRQGGIYKGPVVTGTSFLDTLANTVSTFFGTDSTPKKAFDSSEKKNKKKVSSFVSQAHPNPNNGSEAQVLRESRNFANGGGYRLTAGTDDSGCPETILHNGTIILEKSRNKTTYCSGFTFAVLMRVAKQRGLLTTLSVPQVFELQKLWYGFGSKTDGEKLPVSALQEYGLGFEIPANEAKPGDFLQIWRANGSGHSTIFLDWVVEGGKRVGLEYRSTQNSTFGIGDNKEYFFGQNNGNVDKNRFYFARLV